MNEPTSPIKSLSAFAPEETGDCFVMLAARQRSTTRDGTPYYRLTMRDASRTVAVMVWSDAPWFAACESTWRVGDCFKLRGRYTDDQYGPQMILERIRLVRETDAKEGFDPAALREPSTVDGPALLDELLALVGESVPHAELRSLTKRILNANADPLLNLPGSLRHHHTFRGGWLTHTVSVTKLAVFVADHYALDEATRSLVICGAVLHDIGKVQELRDHAAGAEYTIEGRLIGHSVLGRDLLRDAIRETDSALETDLRRRLEHILLAHQDGPENGAAREVLSIEAMLVHLVDELDTKHDLIRTAAESTGPESFSDRKGGLHRPVYRSLSVTDPDPQAGRNSDRTD